MKMFSVPLGHYSSNRLLCETGFIYSDNTYDPFDSEEGTCANANLLNSENCIQHSDCKYSITTGGSDLTTIEGKCECSADGISNFCTIATNNTIWQNYIDQYKKAIDGITIKDNQNTVYLREHGWGVLKLMQAEIEVSNYQLFKTADECALRYLSTSGFITTLPSLLIALFALFF